MPSGSSISLPLYLPANKPPRHAAKMLMSMLCFPPKSSSFPSLSHQPNYFNPLPTCISHPEKSILRQIPTAQPGLDPFPTSTNKKHRKQPTTCSSDSVLNSNISIHTIPFTTTSHSKSNNFVKAPNAVDKLRPTSSFGYSFFTIY